MTNRRSFLKNTMALATAATAVSAGPFAEAMTFFDAKKNQTLPIMQVFTDETSAQFKIVVGSEGAHYIVRGPQGPLVAVTLLARFKPPYDSSRLVDHLFVDGLELGQDYQLEIYSTNPDAVAHVNNTGAAPGDAQPSAGLAAGPVDINNYNLIDQRTFRALDTKKIKPRLGFVSCMFDFFPGEKNGAWESLRAAQPDVVFLIGDQSYADIGSFGTKSGLWMRHFQSRTQIDYFHWPALVPTFTIFDDHDWGQNNCDKNMKHHADGLAIFNMLFASGPREGFIRGLGASSMLRLFGQRFVLFDDRSYRDPAGPTALHWGDDQEHWFFDQLVKDRGPIWMVNGNVFFGGYFGNTEESVEWEHPFQFKRVLGRLAQLPDPAVFVSGDVHFSEVMKIEKEILGYETVEIVSSSIHSSPAGGDSRRKQNPRRLSATFEHNYVVVDLDSSQEAALNLKITSGGAKGVIFYEQDVSLSISS